MLFNSIMKLPDFLGIETENDSVTLSCSGDCAAWNDVSVHFDLSSCALHVRVSAQDSALTFLRLRWNMPMPEGASYLGDAYERAYGTLEWRHMAARRFMPWYFFASLQNETAGYGVKVRPGALCFWQTDDAGITLWLDIRCGGAGVQLNGRTLSCADIVFRDYQDCSPFDACCRFCGVMCTDPILPDEPVYGSNNWYYTYGYSSHEMVLEDADLLAELTKGLENRPYMVIDSCWQPETIQGDFLNNCAGGPWDCGNIRFPDMKGLADEIVKKDLKPGIWIRPLQSFDSSLPDHWHLRGTTDLLDPSVPEVLAQLREDIRRIHGWGYQLLKYDFSTIDIFGRWGFAMEPVCAEDGWHFHDRSRTSAEIILELYRTIHEAAPEMILIGCNCIGHLGAGLMHLNRTGDDVSGKLWERTRFMGVNTLAFRMCQNRTFYMADADCVGVFDHVPWSLNRKWAALLAESGTPFFISIRPGLMDETELAEIREMLKTASGQTHTVEPLDWMTNTCPSRWLINGTETVFRWFEDTGVPKTLKPIPK